MANSTNSPDEVIPDGTVCLANIGPRQQRMRFRFGMAMFGLGVIVAALLIFMGVNPLWRFGLFLPFYIGGIGYFQARDKT